MEMNLSEIDMRDAFFDGVYETAKNDKNVIFLTCDHSAFSLIKFEKDFPNQFINMGISEQNMTGVSAGLALSNKTVYMYGIAPFVTFRCLEQINIDLCSMNLNVNIVSMGTGLTYSSDGPTHHGIQDQAIMSALPNLSIYNVSDHINSDAFAKICHKESGPKIIRIEKGKFPILYEKNNVDFSDGLSMLKEGDDLIIISTGIMVQRAISIANKLKKYNVNAGVIDIFRIKPLNQDLLLEFIESYNKIIVIEENIFTGGLGSVVGTLIAEYNIKGLFKRFAIKDQYCFQSGPREWMQDKFGLGEEEIIRSIER
tara:strand:+ start:208 stop:1143 length:936 start_codon:yes stop_codon:yes gene_type:complete